MRCVPLPAPITAGMPYSRAAIEPWAAAPPLSVTRPFAWARRGVHAGTVVGTVGGRRVSANRVLSLADRGVRASTIQLPRTVHNRTVHNKGDGGFAGFLTRMAHQTGVASYPGDGDQRWPAVHALDAAVLFRLALEKALGGTAWHAVADEGDSVRGIVTVIGRRP